MALLLFPFTAFPASDWTQDAHDSQRTGFTAEEPVEPWTFAWTFNGPDSNGGTNGSHLYHAPKDARTITGGSNVYVPAAGNGLYALAKSNGAQAWRSTATSFNATPAYDSAGFVFAGGANGTLYKFNASSGAVSGSYNAGSALNKAVLLVGSFAYVVSDDGRLHKVNTTTMASAWVYTGGSTVATPPSYSPSRDCIVYCTDDLFVHAVNNSNGTQKWRVKPTPNTAGFPNEFEGYWPVIAEQHGVVFVRMRLDHNAGLWGYPSTGNIWPNSNAQARSFLQSNPSMKNLFALNLDNGTEKFIPAVGYGGVEDLVNGSAYLNTGPVPVVKVGSDGKEIAYQLFRNGQSSPPDGRWDSQFGEMVLDNTTIANYVAGDLRFVHWIKNIVITDEQCPITMAGDTLFHAHWGASESAKILDRSAARGLSYADPITTQKHPTVIRRQQSCGNFVPSTHWTTCGLTLFDDGRFWDGPGFWVYWNVLDPPTPHRAAYSEGVLPRYTYVADGLIIIEGNGGDLTVLHHSGTAPTPPAAPSNLSANALSSSSIGLSWTDNSNNETQFKIERKIGAGGTYGQITTVGAGVTTFTDTGLSPSTTYYYRVRASNSAGDSAYSNEANATTQSAGGGLPSPWVGGDIGAVAAAGSSSYSGGTFTVTASGADIWGNADEFYFVRQTLNGDGTIIARVATLQNTDPWSKAGVMMRETTNPDAKHCMIVVSSANGVAFQRRVATAGVTTHTAGPVVAAPYWVKLVRAGNIFTASASSNGSSWTTVGSETNVMASSIQVGLAVTSHLDGSLCTATIDNVSITTPSAAVGVSFTGGASGSYGAVNDAAALDIVGSALCMEAFVKVTALPAAGKLGTIIARELGSSSGYALLIGDNGRIQVRLGTSGNNWGQLDTGALTWNSGQWYHVAASYDGTTLRAFRDGVQQGSAAQTGTLLAGANKLYFGGFRYDWAANDFLNAVIDEGRLSKVSRYTANFTPPSAPFSNDSNTVGLWHFNENTGTSSSDVSGNGLTVTLTGAIWTGGKF